MGHEGVPLVDEGRRRLLKQAAVASAVTGMGWVAPEIARVGSVAAAQSGTPAATVTLGAATHVNGNSVKSVPLPTGTFTTYLLLVGRVVDTGVGVLPTLVSGGFTSVTTNLANPPTIPRPTVGVWRSTSANPGSPQLQANTNNDRWTAVVVGFGAGTTVTASPWSSASMPSTVDVNGATATVASTWIIFGSATPGTGPNNWGPAPTYAPPGYTKLLDVDGPGNSATPPDLYVARFGIQRKTIAPITGLRFSAGPSQTAKAIHLGVG